MSYTLYNREGSGGFAVEAALVMADLPFELVTLSSTPGTPLDESFKATNPWGQIPTLIDSDGNVIVVSALLPESPATFAKAAHQAAHRPQPIGARLCGAHDVPWAHAHHQAVADAS